MRPNDIWIVIGAPSKMPALSFCIPNSARRLPWIASTMSGTGKRMMCSTWVMDSTTFCTGPGSLGGLSSGGSPGAAMPDLGGIACDVADGIADATAGAAADAIAGVARHKSNARVTPARAGGARVVSRDILKAMLILASLEQRDAAFDDAAEIVVITVCAMRREANAMTARMMMVMILNHELASAYGEPTCGKQPLHCAGGDADRQQDAGCHDQDRHDPFGQADHRVGDAVRGGSAWPSASSPAAAACGMALIPLPGKSSQQ